MRARDKHATLPPFRKMRLYAQHEARHWSYLWETDEWTRHSASRYTTRLRVRPSSIEGLGLFAAKSLCKGQLVGKVCGSIVERGFRNMRDACQWKLNSFVLSDRVIVLEEEDSDFDVQDECDPSKPTTYAIVDVRHSEWPFEFSNTGPSNTCNMEVDPTGIVSTTRDVETDEELTWDYGEFFTI